MSPRILICDSEVSPEFNATYGKNYEASVLHTETYQYMFCFSYQWLGGATRVVSLTDFPLYKKDPFNDLEVIKAYYAITEEANLIVCHNVNFDVNFFRQRAIFHGLKPSKPVKTFCTLKWSRRNLKLNSNSLKNVADYFGVKAKMETSKGLWQGIHYTRSEKAWREIKLYCKIDTIVCSQIYKIMSAWDSKPSPIYIRELCKNCGSDDVQYRGWSKAKKPKRHFVCKKCFRWGLV